LDGIREEIMETQSAPKSSPPLTVSQPVNQHAVGAVTALAPENQPVAKPAVATAPKKAKVTVAQRGTVYSFDVLCIDGSRVFLKFNQGMVEMGGDADWGTGDRIH
jgi:hypothetical protein